MEYERQNREERQRANLIQVGTWVGLSGPVGLRGRVANVKNSNEDQQKVIILLSQIPSFQGGKKEDWEVPPLAGPDGVCPQTVALAIWDFQLWWKRAGLFHNIDGVVDPGGNTLRYLNLFAASANFTSQ